MHRTPKWMMAVCVLLAVAFSGTAASAVTTNLPAGVLIGDQSGIHVNADGGYFIDWTDLKAGDTLTKTLTIRNLEPYAYSLSMTAEPLEETGPLRLLDEVSVRLVLDGTLLYEGRVRGDDGVDMVKNAIDLGSYGSNQVHTLQISMTVSPEMKTYYWTTSEAQFKWTFFAAQPSKGDGPKTGEIVTYGIYVLLGGMLLSVGILLIVKRKQRERKETEER